MKIKKLDIFDHRIIFLLLTLYFIFVPFSIVLINGDLTFIDFVILILAVTSFGCYLIFSTLKLSVKNILGTDNLNGSASLFGFILLGVDIFLIYQFLNINPSNEDYTNSYVVENHTALYIQVLFLFYLYAKLYVFAYFCARNKFLFYFVFLVEVVLYSFSQVRLISLMPFVVFGCYGYYLGFLSISYVRIAVVMLLAPFIFVVGLEARKSTTGNKVQTALNMYNNFDFDNFVSVLYVAMESNSSYYYLKNIINDNFVRPESGIIRNIFLPISRDIWIDKPEAISRIIAKQYNIGLYENGGGAVATIFGDGFINGHFLGVFIICGIYAVIMSAIYRPVISKPGSRLRPDPGFVMLYAICVHQSLFFFRGFFSDSIWRLVMLFLVFYLLSRVGIQRYQMPFGRKL